MYYVNYVNRLVKAT